MRFGGGLRSVPGHIRQPPYAATGKVRPPEFHRWWQDPESAETIEKLRVAGRFAREMLDLSCRLAEPGVTSDEIDRIVHERIVLGGAYPAPLNYMGFPKSICSSPNDVCCHGIPDDRPLEKGDLVSFDVSLYLDGVFGDNCATVHVGHQNKRRDLEAEDDDEEESSDEKGALMDLTKVALENAVAAMGPGVCLTRVGEIITDVAEARGFGVVDQYCGHGIGTTFHAPPLVQHTRNHDTFLLRPGHVFTIEPIITMRPSTTSVDPDDKWTVRTDDPTNLAAQFEHMVLITDHGHDILTLP